MECQTKIIDENMSLLQCTNKCELGDCVEFNIEKKARMKIITILKKKTKRRSQNVLTEIFWIWNLQEEFIVKCAGSILER